jgi:hypothetical protein
MDAAIDARRSGSMGKRACRSVKWRRSDRSADCQSRPVSALRALTNSGEAGSSDDMRTPQRASGNVRDRETRSLWDSFARRCGVFASRLTLSRGATAQLQQRYSRHGGVISRVTNARVHPAELSVFKSYKPSPAAVLTAPRAYRSLKKTTEQYSLTRFVNRKNR